MLASTLECSSPMRPPARFLNRLDGQEVDLHDGLAVRVHRDDSQIEVV